MAISLLYQLVPRADEQFESYGQISIIQAGSCLSKFVQNELKNNSKRYIMIASLLYELSTDLIKVII